MAVRIDASGDYLRRTTSLPDDALFSACGWAKVTTDRNTYSGIFGIENATSSATTYLTFQTDSTGTQTKVYRTGASDITGPNLTVGEWFFWAYTTSGLGNGTLYFARVGDAALTTYTQSGTATAFTPAVMFHGATSYSGEWLNGCLDGLKVWDAHLSQAEIEAERWSRRPVRTANLHLWWPQIHGDATSILTDFSGNAKTATAGGTLTIEHGAPVPWGAGDEFEIPVASSSLSLAADSGAYTLTGVSAGVKASRQIVAAQGSYTLTGVAAGLVPARAIVAAPGAYTLTGVAAGLAATRTMAAATGSYTLTGSPAGLLATRLIVAAAGSYTLTGAAAGLLPARAIAAAPGSYTLTGMPSGLLATRQMAAAAGAYTLTGVAAGLFAARTLPAESGSYAVAGNDATLTVSGGNVSIAAEPGAYAIVGNAVALTVTPLPATGPAPSGTGPRIAPLPMWRTAAVETLREPDEFTILQASRGEKPTQKARAVPLPQRAAALAFEEADAFATASARSVCIAAAAALDEDGAEFATLTARRGLPSKALLAWWMHNAS